MQIEDSWLEPSIEICTCNGKSLNFIVSYIEQDPASLVRSMASKDAAYFRQHVSWTLADVMFKWMTEMRASTKSRHGVTSVKMQQQQGMEIETETETKTCPPSAASGLALWTALRDRRMKVIFLKVLNGIRSDPILMLRFGWTSLTILLTASMLALWQSLAYWSEECLTSISCVLPKQFVISVPWNLCICNIRPRNLILTYLYIHIFAVE